MGIEYSDFSIYCNMWVVIHIEMQSKIKKENRI